MKKILKNKKGFTLVELIVVIAILGVLAVIMVPAFTGYVQKANNSKQISNVKSWCTAYQAAYAENLVTTGTWDIGTINASSGSLGAITKGTNKLVDAVTFETSVVTVTVTDGNCVVK